MKHVLRAILIAGLLLTGALTSRSATVTLTATDALNETSWDTGLHWSDGLPPSAGNDYVVPLQWLRTPTASGQTYTFAGDSLTITGAGGLIFKSDNSTHVINNLIMADGGIIWGGNTGGSTGTVIAGNLSVVMTGTNSPTIHANQSSYDLNSYITGSGDLTLAGSYSITLNGTNAMTGDIIVSAGTKTFSTNSLSIFTIGANGVNNAITGAGAVFNGTFAFNLTGASTTLGHSWAVTTAGAAFGDTFAVQGFLDNGDGTWFRDNGTAKYKFYESTGQLECVLANIIPIAATGITPADGSIVFNPQPLISITLIDGSADAVIPGSIAMTVNGGSVTPGVSAPSAGTHLVSYTPAAPLAAGPVNVVVTYDDDAANSHTNSWAFSIHPTTTDRLWNINIAGSSSGVLRPVSDGVVAIAPSAGANLWNNVAGVNSSLNTFSINDSNGGNTIGYETSGSHNWGESTANGMTVQMFQGWTGANAPMNMTNVLTGLDPDDAYDIYLYSTWRWTQNPVNYTIIEGFADVTSGTITEVQANVQNAASNDYSGCVYGQNYIIFTNVTPTAAGRIAFTGVSTDGVISGLQILQIPGGANTPELMVGGTVPADGTRFVSATPTLKAYFIDIDETVNSGSINMTIDGSPVTASFSYSNPTSTVSYTVTSPFDPMTVHTARVIVASTPSGVLYTNEWSFKVAPVPGNIVYVDADTTNTLAWNGTAFSTFVADGVSPNWTTRTGLANNSTCFQGQFTADSPRLKTTVSGLPDATYDVYVYMWVQGNTWRIQSALTNNLSGALPLYLKSDYPANPLLTVPWVDYDPANTWGNWATPATNPYLSGNLPVNPFASGTVLVSEADRRLMQVYLGQVSGTEITVYVDDDPAATDSNGRTWFDGIGYEEYTGGPTFDPVIQAIIVSGGNVALTWTSEEVATYTILRKTSLSAPTWTPVKTGIAGGSPTTSDAVSASGSAAEFYQIKGE